MPEEPSEVDAAASGADFVSGWIRAGLDLTPLTEPDRRRVEAGLAALHTGLGLPWHDNVVWVRSPQELTRALSAAPALMRGPYLAAAHRAGRGVHLVRAGRALSRATSVLGYAAVAALLTFLPAYYAGTLVDGLAGHQLGRTSGALIALVLLFTVGSGLLTALVLGRAALNTSRRVFAPIGADLEQRLRPVLTRGRPAAQPDAAEPVRRALSGLWSDRLLDHAWTEGTPVRGFHRDGLLGDPASVGAAGRAQALASGSALITPRDRSVLAGLLDLRRALVWVPYAWVTVVLEPPSEMFTETAGAQVRLHRADGPALVWPDRQVEFYLHGVRIPAELAAREPSVRELHAADPQVRRVLIEREGWPHYLDRAGLRLLSAVPDPGNPGRQLRLYRAPPGVFGSDRILLMTNGSPDRGGTLRQYAELVPDGLDDPVEAAAWQYGVSADLYRDLARRT